MFPELKYDPTQPASWILLWRAKTTSKKKLRTYLEKSLELRIRSGNKLLTLITSFA